MKSEKFATAQKTHKVYLSLGSNLGNREENISRAIALIAERVGQVVRRSSLIETEPWGFESANKFLNGVILIETELTPRQVLEQTQQIERELGRRKTSRREPKIVNSPLGRRTLARQELSIVNYKDRPIDIDILLYDDLHVDEPDLKIPHPLMHERDFVMIPLREVKSEK